MKIALFSHLAFTENEFPLIREFQREGTDIDYYIQVYPYSLRAGLIDIKKQYPHNGIFPAEVYPEFSLYKDYLDLSRVFVMNCTKHSNFHPYTIWTYIKFLWRLRKSKIDILHITWPLERIKLLLYFFRKKLVLTLHDPFPHSGKSSREHELYRRLSTLLINKIIMLNDKELNRFSSYYNYSQKKIFINKMGDFDYLRCVEEVSIKQKVPYILFFGNIAPYKGVEYLMEAMRTVHDRYPNVKLLIAGGGKLYMDKSLYEDADYIEIRNHYINISELIGLLKNCLFAICPYKDATQSGVVQTAFSLSIPVVATNVGTLPEIVKDRETGRLVPPCDTTSLANAIAELLHSPQQLDVYRNNIQKLWSKEMRWEPIVKKYLEVYEC